MGEWGSRFGAAILLGIALTACQGSSSTRADYVGPDTHVLIKSFMNACPDGSSARKGTVAVMGRDFQPGTAVTLNWSVVKRELHGSWHSVVASSHGDFTAHLELPANRLKPGDVVDVWAQGSGKNGIMALRTKVPIGRC